MTINFLFPVFYMKRIAEGAKEIKTDDILSDFKTNRKKVIKAYFGLSFLVMPVATVLFGFSYFLIIILIGIVLILIAIVLNEIGPNIIRMRKRSKRTILHQHNKN